MQKIKENFLKIIKRSDAIIVISLLLLIISLGVLVYFKDSILLILQGSDEQSSVVDIWFLYRFLISMIIFVFCLGVFIYNKLKSDKLESKFKIIVSLFISSFIFNILIFSCFLGLLVYLTDWRFDNKIFDKYLFCAFIFAVNFVIVFGNIIDLLKRDDLKDKMKLVLTKTVKTMVFMLSFMIIVLSLLFLVNNKFLNYEIISVFISLIISTYSGSVLFLQQINLFADYLD